MDENIIYWEDGYEPSPVHHTNNLRQTVYFVDEYGNEYPSVPNYHPDDNLVRESSLHLLDDHRYNGEYTHTREYNFPHEYSVYEEDVYEPYLYPQHTTDTYYQSSFIRDRFVLLVVLFIAGGLGSLFYFVGQPSLIEVSDVPVVSANVVSHQIENQQVEIRNNVPMPSGQLPVWLMPSVLYWEDLILNTATTYGVDPLVLAIVMQVESCGDPQATSGAGARGLFQVMPFHFEYGEDMYNPETNAMRGAKYLVEGVRLHTQQGFTGDDILFRTFAGYNGGHGSVWLSYSHWAHETQRYYVWTTGMWGDAQSGGNTSPTLTEWLVAGGSNLCRSAETRLGI